MFRRLLRHVVLVVWVVFASAALLEGIARVGVSWSLDYYTSFRQPPPGELDYPFGNIPINADLWPDAPFATDGRRRIAWVGDSVLYGIGAPYGERVTEVLEQADPGIDHMNFGVPGWRGVIPENAQMLQRLPARYDAEAVIYLMTLNDVGDAGEGIRATLPTQVFERTQGRLDQLLDSAWLLVKPFAHRSYALTWYYLNQPFRPLSAEHIGMPELYPDTNRELYAATGRRIRALADIYRAQGVPFTVLVLPYEMQISEEAAQHYARVGSSWEPSFIGMGPVDLLQQQLHGTQVLDLSLAFLDPEDGEGSRSRIARCAYFVCERGGRLDYVHLTPEGHRKIAEHVLEMGLFDRGQGPRVVADQP